VSGWLDAVGTVVNPLGKVAERPEAKEFFDVGDTVLNHGGQVALDAVALVPGVGEVANAAQAEYHLLHASNDFARTDRAVTSSPDLPSLHISKPCHTAGAP
jgi:hypothetical protein